MKIPIEWLKEYVELAGFSDGEISEALTMSGTENEMMVGASFPNIVVGEIKEISKHPDADKLQVTKTDVGPKNGGTLQIVCGAPNIEVGQKVPVALVGAVIGEFEIGKAKIRGVESNGMLCSESELGISDDHTGIMILDARAKIGQPLGEVLNIGGTVLDAEITPNRSDCFSIIGVAREASAALNRKLINIKFQKSAVTAKEKVAVEVKEKELCPRYIAKVVENVKIGPSPKWLADRLSASGVRPINNIVDVTNYVMLEWGQPLHAFDAEKISEKIIVRKAKSGEALETLDGTKRELQNSDLVIADAKKAIALAGVMGGANSEVSESSKTIVLEAAVFKGSSVRRTAQRLGLRTEASNRFEKGIPLGLPEIAIERAAQLIEELAGGKVGENSDALGKWIWIQHVGIEQEKLNEFLGAKVEKEKVIEILKSLDFEIEEFNFKKEARKHVGKPYVWGASFKTHGDMAFDCSYLTDYIYSRIGQFIGHTALAQFEQGIPVKKSELQSGDILFIKGEIKHSATDHYYENDGNGNHTKNELENPKEVGHNALYIGDGRIVHAAHYAYDTKTKKWSKIDPKKSKVIEEDVEKFLNHPEYLGARRFIENPEGWLAITVPWWRLDVRLPEDIYEEVGRIYGYEKLPSVLPRGKTPKPQENKKEKLIAKIKNILVGTGYSEVLNYSFISEKNLSKVGFKLNEVLKVANPISPEQEIMRPTISASLLEDANVNKDNFDTLYYFEIAADYLPQKNDLPEEPLMLGIYSSRKNAKNAADFYELKGTLELIWQKLGLGSLILKPAEEAFLAKGQTAAIYLGGKDIGYLGIVSPKTTHEFDLKRTGAIAELNLSEVLEAKTEPVKYKPIPRFPIAQRDFNILISNEITAQKIAEKLNDVEESYILKKYITDVYTGEDLPPGQKSVTIRVSLGSAEKTLTEEEIAKTKDNLFKVLKNKLGATERF